jgi:NAD(P)H-hydrate epimerase
MRALLSKKEMQALDRAAIDDVGIPSLVLMEVAGRAVADRVEALARGRVLALAGLGNNGADAIVAARHLADRGLAVTTAIAGDPAKASGDCKKQLAIIEKLGAKPLILDEHTDLGALFAGHAIAIDGLFGTGLSRPIEGLAAKVIEAVNAARIDVVAVDIASGIDADDGRILGAAVRATETVTFQHAKLGHVFYPGREHTGALHVADIGIPRALLAGEPSAFIVEKDAIERALPKRRRDTHKGTYGHLLVVAGAPDRPGSALLAGRAAMRAGAGLATIAADPETIRRLSPAFEALMGASTALDAKSILALVEGKSALAIGPSLPATEATKAFLLELLPAVKVPVVIDASALAALGTDVAKLAARAAPTILTPHPGEMAKLAGLDTKAVQADRAGVARAVAAKARAVVVLKGASTVIAAPDQKIGVVLEGNAGMATGGAGDVLTGVIGGLVSARGAEAFDAAAAGVLLHALAGDRAARSGEARLVASDLIDHLALAEDGAP